MPAHPAYKEITELIGDTPLVRLNRLLKTRLGDDLCQGRIIQSGRKRQGPDLPQYDQRGGAAGQAEAGRTRSSNRPAETPESGLH